jgi:hypothetical protein
MHSPPAISHPAARSVRRRRATQAARARGCGRGGETESHVNQLEPLLGAQEVRAHLVTLAGMLVTLATVNWRGLRR